MILCRSHPHLEHRGFQKDETIRNLHSFMIHNKLEKFEITGCPYFDEKKLCQSHALCIIWPISQNPTHLLERNEKTRMCRQILCLNNIFYYHVIQTLFFSLFPTTTGKTCSSHLVLFGFNMPK